MHVARVRSVHGGKEYVSVLLRQSYREDGKVKKRTLANLSAPARAADRAHRSLARGRALPAAGRGALASAAACPTAMSPRCSGWPARSGCRRCSTGGRRAAGTSRSALVARPPDRPRLQARHGGAARRRAPWARPAGSRAPTRTSCTGRWTGCSPARRGSRLPSRARHLAAGSLVLYDLSVGVRRGQPLPARAPRPLPRPPARPAADRVRPADRRAGLPGRGRGLPGQHRRSGHRRGPGRQAAGPLRPRPSSSSWATGGCSPPPGSSACARLGGIGWVSCLRAPAIRRLVDAGDLQLWLFDERNLAEITSPEFPGERLVVCRNPALAAERARKREALLAATEDALARVAASVERGTPADRRRDRPARGAGGQRQEDGQALRARHRRGRASPIAGGPTRSPPRPPSTGCTSCARASRPERLDAPAVVETYKRLSAVERDFRALKGDDLAVRPIFHWREDRVRAHLFLCFLAAYVRWHLEAAWAPLLFRDEAPPARTDPVAPRARSAAALAKERDHRTPDGLRVGSFADAAGRARHAHPQPGRAGGRRRAGGLRAAVRAHPAPGPGVRADRGHARERVDRAPQPREPHPRSDLPVCGWKFGLTLTVA